MTQERYNVETTNQQVMQTRIKLTLTAGLWLTSAWAWAEIYTCVDIKGRRMTSDRPIAECADREQKELNRSGTVKRTVKPVMTAQERQAFEEKQKAELEEQTRVEEEKRKNRALLSRYPNRASHDREREETLAQIDEVIKAANKRIGELALQRKTIDTEMEFYKKDPKKVPFTLKRQTEDNDSSVTVQKRFIADQDEEKKRVNTRFDEQLARLKMLWLLTVNPSGQPTAGLKK